jgi:putative FmdB family regulatory protein
MPLYEYECRKCGERFERIQRVDAAPVTACPRCGGAVHRLMGVPALQFKGSGWYVTDYAKGNGRDTASSAPDTRGGAAADTAPAKASETPATSDGSRATKD